MVRARRRCAICGAAGTLIFGAQLQYPVNDYSTVQRNRLRLEFMHVSLHSGTLKLSMATTTHRASGLLVDVLDKLLADKSFGPPSAAAVTARKTGECLHQWLAAAEHQEKAKAFSDSLLASLDTFSIHG